MKQIFEVMELAWMLGIKVTEIKLTKDQIKDILVDEDKQLESIETPYGKVRIAKL